MEKRAIILQSRLNREIGIKVMAGHFATKHSHVTHCIDMTDIKSQLNSAKATAKILSDSFQSTPVDTIITLERMKMVGAFMAHYLNHGRINLNHNITVITPEFIGDKVIFRDNFLPFVMNCHVLLVTASATTGQTVRSAIEGIRYYGGSPVGAATVFGSDFECEVPVVKLFGLKDIAGYASYSPQECPLCKKNVRVDAVINSYGYSKL